MIEDVLRVSESMVVNQNCFKCSTQSIKNGKSQSGKQRYYCKGCRRSFQMSYLYRACGDRMTNKIISLTREGCSLRSISRLLKISITTIIRRIKAYARALSRPFAILRGKEYEVDEMRTYVGNKSRPYWIVYALEKNTKEVIDFRVGKRSLKTLQGVTHTLLLSEAKMIFTDGYGLYRQLIPEAIHSRRKYQINTIERKNLSIRTHLKRLNRKTICFSKSRQMLEACLKIYFWSEKPVSL
jgi:insertion element IS1 protein InsB